MLVALALQQHQHEVEGGLSFHLACIGVGPLTCWLALRTHGPGPGAKWGVGCSGARGCLPWTSAVAPTDRGGQWYSLCLGWVGVRVRLLLRKLELRIRGPGC